MFLDNSNSPLRRLLFRLVSSTVREVRRELPLRLTGVCGRFATTLPTVGLLWAKRPLAMTSLWSTAGTLPSTQPQLELYEPALMFLPQNGANIMIGPVARFGSVWKSLEYQVGITPPLIKSICTDYTINGSVSTAAISGPVYFDGGENFLATENISTPILATSTFYSKGNRSEEHTSELQSLR